MSANSANANTVGVWVRAAEIGVPKLRAAENDADQVRAAEIGLPKLRAAEIGIDAETGRLECRAGMPLTAKAKPAKAEPAPAYYKLMSDQ